MNERLDYLLGLLYGQRRIADGIFQTFEQAGYGSTEPYLKQLISKGFVEKPQDTREAYTLSEKGKIFYIDGGFTHTAERAHESRVALALTSLAIIVFPLMAYAIWYFGK